MTKTSKIIKRNRVGNIVAIYPSVIVAAREENTSRQTIYSWCAEPGKIQKNGYAYEHGAEITNVVPELKTRDTLCWDCENACGRCSWSKQFKPVEGWTAERRDVWVVRITNKGETRSRFEESYIVIKCPKFILDRRLKEE